MANSMTRRLDELEDRAAKAELAIKKLNGTIVAHGVALKAKDKDRDK
jgi:uncharacterized coiled-coil protein SlyX